MTAAPAATENATVGRSLETAARRLRAAGIEGARRDARLLLAAALDLDPAAVMAWPERRLAPGERARIDALVARRAAREPVSRILGRREFWSLDIAVSAATLDPRPDSEALVAAMLARLPDRSAPLEILDLGTGTGCLLLALLSELPAARGLGTDICPEALVTARGNAERLGLARRAAFVADSWGQGLAGSWQAIVSNPPYIKDRDIAALAPEVAEYDPRAALSGGADGLEAYRALIPQATRLLAPDGLLGLEIGHDQQSAVEDLLAGNGLRPEARIRDLAGIERCLVARPARGGQRPKKVVGNTGITH